MSDNDPILLGRAVPDEMAKKVSEVLNRKSITPENELADALDEMARDITLIEPDPQDWGGWVIYQLEQMEVEAERRGKRVEFDDMIHSLYRYLIER